MPASETTLFYGLWVTTASLNFAPTAHMATRPTVLAIDLIITRRRRGKLEIEGQDEKTKARDLPEEVWEMVKREMIKLEIRAAKSAAILSLCCSSGASTRRLEKYRPGSRRYDHDDEWGLPQDECDVCCDKG
jgi:hypothetical protein